MARANGRSAGRPFSASTSGPSKPVKTQNKRKKTDPANAYTYLPSLPKRHRTSEQTLSLTRDEEQGAKERRPRAGEEEEEDDDDDMDARIRRVAMMIAEEGPGGVESDESDIDSDEAWEEGGSDDERWGEVFRDLEKGKKKKKAKGKEEVVKKPAKPLTVNLDESEDDVPAPKASAGKAKAAPVEDIDDDDEDEEEDKEDEEEDEEDGEEEGDEEEEEEDDEEDDEEEAIDGEDSEDSEDSEDDAEFDLELPSDLSDDEEGPDTLDGLDSFVEKLAASDKKRKSGEDEVESTKKRRVLPVASGPALGNANDLGLKSSQKVDLASLIASHPSLSSASSLLPSKSKSSTSNTLKQGVLSAPLPTVVQDRLNREAAYEKTKEEGAKWATLMKRVKEAEHLSFPLQGGDRGGVKTSGEMLATFKPQNAHESAVQALLAKANLTESGVKQSEDEALRGKDLTPEEIAERRSQLRQQRELMFREEARRKRVSKIKSKTYRKLARKRAAKEGEAALEDMDEEDALAAQEKMERERAKERATLKHGARTSRWARDGAGEEHREAKQNMLDIKERLNRRIAGKGDESSEEESESGGEEEEDEEAIRARAFDQLDRLDAEEMDKEEGAKGKKGLANMAFMQKARERQRQAAREEEDELRKDMEMFGEDGEESEGDEEEKAAMLKIGGTGGRMVFSGPQPTSNTAAAPAPALAPTTSVPTTTATTTKARSPSPLPDPEENPWLAASSTSGPSRKRNTALTASSSTADKAAAQLKKAKSAANGKGKASKVDDGTVEIETDGNKLLAKKKKAVDDEGSDEDDELMPRQRVGFKQRDLVAEAFAGDNVVEDFATEKQRVIEADAPKVEDTSLPGWGSWGGKGAKKRATNPKFLKKTAGVEAGDRKDAKFSNVIITEKKDRKAAAFQVTDLPYPYTSIAQYEARFSNPLGAEWNSRAIHQKETMPRVTKKKGAIIEPVRRLF